MNKKKKPLKPSDEFKRETVGKIITDIRNSTDDVVRVKDITEVTFKDYPAHFYETLDDFKKKFPGNFYIIVFPTVDHVLKIRRNRFGARLTCPTPTFDQIVYKFYQSDERIKFIWAMPSRKRCDYLRVHALSLSKGEKELLKHVLDFFDGSLDRLADTLDKEENYDQRIN